MVDLFRDAPIWTSQECKKAEAGISRGEMREFARAFARPRKRPEERIRKALDCVCAFSPCRFSLLVADCLCTQILRNPRP